MRIDPETLAAYADGQLNAAEAARVEAAIAADPALMDEVAAHRALRERLRAHFASVAEQPVPERLLAAFRSRDSVAGEAPRDNVVQLAAMRQARSEGAQRRLALPRLTMGGALAASLALGLMIGSQMRPSDSIATHKGQIVADGALNRALTSDLAGSQPAGAPRMLLSFKAIDGHYCRAFEDGANAGIACRSGGEWAIERLQSVDRPAAPNSGYRQAGSSAADIMAAAQDMAAGPALDARAEHLARDAGWRGDTQ